MYKGPGRWKMDPLFINDEHIRRRISKEWVEWRKRKQYYPDVTQWWESCIKTDMNTHPERNAGA
jgi:hypothetical protein